MSVGYSVGQFQILTLSALVSLDRHRAFVETCFNPKLAYTTFKLFEFNQQQQKLAPSYDFAAGTGGAV